MKNGLGRVRAELMYFMGDVRELMREQGQIVVGSNYLMFRFHHVGRVDASWKGHAIGRMYLRGVYSAVWRR